jgi:hypothetical protein
MIYIKAPSSAYGIKRNGHLVANETALAADFIEVYI